MLSGAGGARHQGDHPGRQSPQPPRRFHKTLIIAIACTAAGCQAGKPAAGHQLPPTSPSAPAPALASSPAPASAPVPAPAPSLGAARSPSAPPSPSTPPAHSPAATGGLAGRIVVIDPGHNGMNWAHPAQINAL